MCAEKSFVYSGGESRVMEKMKKRRKTGVEKAKIEWKDFLGRKTRNYEHLDLIYLVAIKIKKAFH